MFEQRAHPRFAVNIPAVVFGATDLSIAYGATIVDLSKDGAQLRMKTAVTLPRRVWVLELHYQNAYDCEVRWLRGMRMGVLILDLVDRNHRKTLIQALTRRTSLQQPSETIRPSP
jgi:hypothetical protein